MSGSIKAKSSQDVQFVSANRGAVKWVMFIYFCSGVCSLIDEVVWVRLLKLTLGNTVYASSIVVSVFMGGLALGALIMTRYADHLSRRLRLYAVLEVCATISALSLPLVLRFAEGLYRWYFVRYEPSPTQLLFVQVLLSGAILLVPAMAMGSTLPLLGRYITSLQSRVGPLVGRLYALNMLGAALGCFLAGFVLIRLVGVMGTLYIAAGINTLVAIGGWSLSRFHDVDTKVQEQAWIAPKLDLATTGPAQINRYILMAAFFMSGLISIGYELIWMRSIVFLLGGFTYVFSAVLTAYLLGNVIGAWLGSGLSKLIKHPAIGFGISLTCLGILGIFYIPSLTVWHLKVIPLFSGLAESPGIYRKEALLPLCHSIFLFIIPAVTMGIGFPLALQAWGNFRHKVGETTGTVYGVNMIGAVLGGLVSGFVLIPLMGTQLSITVLGLLAIWFGAIMVQVFGSRLSTVFRLVYLVIPVGLTFAAVTVPSGIYERNVLKRPGYETLFVKEGVTTTVTVTKDINNNLQMGVDGIYMAGDDIHRSTQKLLGHLGLLLNKDAKEVLSVGFGTGETSACLAEHKPNSIDCVEIAPEVVQVGLNFFSHINLGNRLNQKVNLIYMDAKNYLRLTAKHYDVIINDSNVHNTSGSAPLYTKEHFENALEHLKPGGLFITKLHLQGQPKSGFDSIVGTFLEVYPYVTIWFPTTKPYIFFYLVGSRDRQIFSPKHIDEKLGKENIRNSVAYLNFNNSSDVLSCYIADESDIRIYLKNFHLNSDYTPYVEFNLDQTRLVPMEFFRQFVGTIRQNSLVRHMDWTGLTQAQQDKWRKQQELLYEVSGYVLKSYGEENISHLMQNTFDGLRLMPEHPALVEQRQRNLSLAKGSIYAGSADEAINNMDTLLITRPELADAYLVKAWALEKKNQIDESVTAAKTAVHYAPDNAPAHNYLGGIFMNLGQLDNAIFHYKEAAQLTPNNAVVQFNLGAVFSLQGKLDQAILHFRQGLQIEPQNAQAHCMLADFLAMQGNKSEAINHYREALRLEPGLIRARRALDALSAK